MIFYTRDFPCTIHVRNKACGVKGKWSGIRWCWRQTYILMSSHFSMSHYRVCPCWLTVADGGQTQVLHAVLHQFRELLSLWASVEVEALLVDAFSTARRLCTLSAKPPCPLHALLPQQWMFWLVTAGWVPVGRFLFPGLAPVPWVLTLVHVYRHLRLLTAIRN